MTSGHPRWRNLNPPTDSCHLDETNNSISQTCLPITAIDIAITRIASTMRTLSGYIVAHLHYAPVGRQ